MSKIRLNSFPAAILNRKYEIDGGEVELRGFLNDNFYKKGDKNITPNQVRSIIGLEPEDLITVNEFQIKRIS